MVVGAWGIIVISVPALQTPCFDSNAVNDPAIIEKARSQNRIATDRVTGDLIDDYGNGKILDNCDIYAKSYGGTKDSIITIYYVTITVFSMMFLAGLGLFLRYMKRKSVES